MADSAPGSALTLSEAAALTTGRVVGDSTILVGDLLPLEQAGEGALGFLASRRYLPLLAESRAGAVLTSETLASLLPEGRSALVVPDAHRALASLIGHFHPPVDSRPGIHPTAVLGAGVRLGSGVSIGPYVVLGEQVEIGDDVVLHAHVVVGSKSAIAARSVLHPQVVVYPGSRIGEDVVLHAGVRLGVDGFGYVFQDGEHRKVPQVGGCVVEDRVEIGANTCIDRGSIGRTVVGRGAKLDNLVHLGHNVQVGPGALLVAQVGVAGSTRIGEGAVLGGQAGVSGHLDIGPGARLGAQAGVIGDVPAGETVSGYPARPHRAYLQAMAALFRLPDTQSSQEARIEALEERLRRLEKGEA